jgi:putative nucleic acid binding protein
MASFRLRGLLPVGCVSIGLAGGLLNCLACARPPYDIEADKSGALIGVTATHLWAAYAGQEGDAYSAKRIAVTGIISEMWIDAAGRTNVTFQTADEGPHIKAALNRSNELPSSIARGSLSTLECTCDGKMGPWVVLVECVAAPASPHQTSRAIRTDGGPADNDRR